MNCVRIALTYKSLMNFHSRPLDLTFDILSKAFFAYKESSMTVYIWLKTINITTIHKTFNKLSKAFPLSIKIHQG